MLQFVNDVQLIKHRFTSLLMTCEPTTVQAQ